MNVILFASPLNPLSAVAAHFFSKAGLLKVLVIPKGLPGGMMKSGVIFYLSKLCVGLYRYFHVFLRIFGFKRSSNYSCLLEFLKVNPEIPIIEYSPGMDVEKQIARILGEDKVSECIIFACVFRHKIPTNLSRIKRLINMHPGTLPENRGPNPYFWALAKKKSQSGLTFHVLIEKMDEGDILMKTIFRIEPDLSEYAFEKLSAQALKHALPIFWDKFENLWQHPTPQGEGIYYKEPDFKTRLRSKRLSVINFTDLVRFLARTDKRRDDRHFRQNSQ